MQGTIKALDYFAAMYDNNPDLQSRCHDATHVLGDAAYAQFKKDGLVFVDPATRYCGYGFYHGFIDRMLTEQGAERYSDARTYCDSLLSAPELTTESMRRLAHDACYHGVGHAMFDSVDPMLWGDEIAMTDQGLYSCTLVNDDPRLARICGSGVFNSLAIAKSAREYRLSYDGDPQAVCRLQDAEAAKKCSGELLIGYIRDMKFDRQSALRYISLLKPASISDYILWVYIDDEVKRHMADIDLGAFYRQCASMPQAQACIEGVISGILNGSTPGHEDVRMLEFCGLVREPSQRAQCYRYALKMLSGVDTAEQIQTVCSRIPVDDRAAVKERCTP